MASILVVEDDPSICRAIEMNLQLEGFDVTTVSDGRAALDAVNDTIDLVILDIMLPLMNGYEVCRNIRGSGNKVPIIFISAKNAEMDIVMGLDLGGDDYVTKPFRLAVLMARVKAHLRRQAPDDTVRFGRASIDRTSRQVSMAGAPVELTAKEFDVLMFLVEHAGKALTRDAILRGVWGANYFGTDRSVDNFIQRLRQKLDTPKEPKHFLTVRGVGYRFVGDDS